MPEPMTRRSFLRICGAVGAVGLAPVPLQLFASPDNPAVLLDFAQFSDVHIIDPGHHLRSKNLKLLGLFDLGGLLDPVEPAISRPQDGHTARILEAVIRSVNEVHGKEGLDFVISTGDHTDTDLEHELRWFAQFMNGQLPDDYQDRVRREETADVEPRGLKLPWYAAIGNHDVEYMGTFNSELLVGQLVGTIGAPDADDLASLEEVIDIYRQQNANGFSGMPAGSDGYYSFDPNPWIHCLVLNTANFNLDEAPPVETLSDGVMDRAQFAWIEQELADNPDKLCLAFSHHGPAEFNSLVGQVPYSAYVNADALRQLFCRHPQFVAHINGHTHINRITPVETADGAYWDINTCSVIDYPQEWRRITILDNGDGTGTIACAMKQHKDGGMIDLAYGDPDANPEESRGTEQDRDVDLVFALPPAVRQTIDEELAVAEGQPPTAVVAASSDSDDRCFIATGHRERRPGRP